MKKNKLNLTLIIILFMSVITLSFGASVKGEDTYEVYSSYLPSKSAGSGIIYEPILIFEPTSFTSLSKIDSTKITEVILSPDENMNITFGEDTKTLKETFNSYIKGKYIPVINLTSETVDSFIEWCYKSYFISDLIVMSQDLKVIEKIYKDEKLFIYNSVYDIRDKELYSYRYDNYKYLADANVVGANIG